MTVDIHSPHLKAGSALIRSIEEKVVALSHLNKNISRAEIYLHADKELKKKNRICEIRLEIFGETLFVRRISDSFEKSVITVLKELKKLVTEQAKHLNEPPDITISTVEV